MGLSYTDRNGEDGTISKDKAFDDCVILSKEAFDPDAVFLDDIVDDEVLPYLSLAVDGLTEDSDEKKGKLELRPEDVAANDPANARQQCVQIAPSRREERRERRRASIGGPLSQCVLLL